MSAPIDNLSIPVTIKPRIDRPITLLAAGVTIVCWASAFPAIRAGLQAFSPVHVALLRYLTASLILGIYAVASRMPLPRPRDVPLITLMGFIGFTIYNIFLNWGEVTVPSAIASFIVAGAPIFMILFATLFLHERLRAIGWLGIAMSFGGVAVIAFSNSHGSQIDPRVVVILIAALAQSIYSVAQKPLLTRYPPFQFISYAIWFVTLFMLVFLPGLPDEIRAAPPGALAAVIYLGVIPGALGYGLWSYVLARTPASIASTLLYLVPAIALLIARIWLGEAPSLVAVLGGLLVVSGVIVVNFLGRNRT